MEILENPYLATDRGLTVVQGKGEYDHEIWSEILAAVAVKCNCAPNFVDMALKNQYKEYLGLAINPEFFLNRKVKIKPSKEQHMFYMSYADFMQELRWTVLGYAARQEETHV